MKLCFLYVFYVVFYYFAFETVGLTVDAVEKLSIFICIIVIQKKWTLTYFHDEIIDIGKS